MTVYQVTGRRAYLEYQPGATFETTLPLDMEARAVRNGAIRVLNDSPVTLQPGTVRLADGWETPSKEE